MILGPALITDFPATGLLLKRSLPAVAFQRGKIWEAFVRWSDLEEGAADRALNLGDEPHIHVKYLIDKWGVYRGRSGDPAMDNKIFLDRELLVWYEHCPANKNDTDLEFFIVTTVLHEMCHWGDWRDRHDFGGPDFEEGNMFEREAFGRIAVYKLSWKANYDAYVASLPTVP